MDAPAVYTKILKEMKKHIAGKEDVIELLFLSLLANGHSLLEGVPGVAKTTMTKSLATAIQGDFKRIQGTPDLEVGDIIGHTELDASHTPVFKRGPVFTNILLIDELNRVPPKTMSAFLETLEERQITVGGIDIKLQKPFVAFATQNPLKIEGTEPLPKVLADRFLMKIDVSYPSITEEREMMRIKEREEANITNKIIGTDAILEMQEQVKSIQMPDEVLDYITRMVDATRTEIHVIMGASPRADLAFMQCAKAKALVEGRKEANKADIDFLAKPVLSHRITVRASGGIGPHGIIDGIIASLAQQT